MPTRERLLELGTRRGTSLVREYADEVRQARLAAGISQASLAAGVGLSKSQISRMEHGRPPLPNFVTAARIARVVGLELWVRCYPAPGQLRDAAHVALISRLLARVPPAVDRHLEAQIQPGDPRAWDLLLRFEDGATVGVAAETRIRDLQALLRREEAKLADSGVTRLVLLVANTKHNRRTLAEAGTVVRSAFPLGTRGIFASVGREEVPTSNGLVVL